MHWIARLEAEYDQPIYDLLITARDQARQTGTSLPMLAEEFGCTYWQLHHLCRKLGIKWPAHVSERFLESAREMGKANARKRTKHVATINGITDSVDVHARRLGKDRQTVWWRIKHGESPEDALLTPSVPRQERGERGMQNRYRRSA